jgi:hypothetical protein
MLKEEKITIVSISLMLSAVAVLLVGQLWAFIAIDFIIAFIGIMGVIFSTTSVLEKRGWGAGTISFVILTLTFGFTILYTFLLISLLEV